MTKTLLIIPPLDEPSHPYPAVPQLVSWLRKEGLEVDAADLNIRFYRWLFERSELTASLKEAWRRLEELDEKSACTEAELELYFTLADAFHILGKNGFTPGDTIEKIGRSLPASDALQVAKAVAAISFARFFPEEFADLHLTSLILSTTRLSMSSAGVLRLLRSPAGGLFDEFYDECLPGLNLDRYAVVGISIPFMSAAPPALRLARAVKKLSPGSHLTLGGNYVSMNLLKMNDASLFDVIDSFVVGAGEVPLLETAKRSRSEKIDPEGIPGLAWRENGEIMRNSVSRGLPLEKTPYVDHIFDPAEYPFARIAKKAMLRLTQGCSWGKCAFCNLVGSGLVPLEQPDEKVMFEKVREYVENGRTDICFRDEEATCDMLERFAKRVVDSGLKFRWCINLRFDERIDLKWANLLAQSGCWLLISGLENYNDRILNMMNKGTNTALIDRCLEEISWSGIRLNAYMMTGLPTETEAEAQASFDRLTRQMESGNINFALYSRYNVAEKSPVFVNPRKYGVTKYFMDPELDLAITAEGFEHSGMDGATIRRVFEEFSSTLNKKANRESSRETPLRVLWDGREICCDGFAKKRVPDTRSTVY